MLRLRPYKSCDAEEIAGWLTDEDIFYKWSGGRFGSYPVSATAIDDKYRLHNGDCAEQDNFYPMTAFDDSGVVGHFIMRYLHGDNRILRFGWVIVDAAKRGKSYGSRMLRLGLKYAFEILGAERVTIGVFENNLPAYRCYRAVGFRKALMEKEEAVEIKGEKWKIIELEIIKKTYEYLKNPCGESSIPYWKTGTISVPEGMKIVHQSEFGKNDFPETEAAQWIDEPYFRLRHDLRSVKSPMLPQGYSLCNAVLSDFAGHINQCYDGIRISEAELQSYLARPVYDSSLWLAVRDNQSGDIVATGIAELDREIGEGILEWIQVSERHRRFGLGSYLVAELLWRMKDLARFATVSGQCNNPNHPERLYRKCGFTGNDVWHKITYGVNA